MPKQGDSILSLKDAPRVQLQELNDAHKHALRLMFLGANNKEVAMETGYTKEMVSLIRRSDVTQNKLTEMHDEMDEEAKHTAKHIQELIPRAIEVYEEILLSSAEDGLVKTSDRLRAADAVCDRGGLPRQSATRIDSTVNHLHITGNQIVSLKERALQAARDMGLLVDTTATPVKTGSSSNLPSCPTAQEASANE